MPEKEQGFLFHLEILNCMQKGLLHMKTTVYWTGRLITHSSTWSNTSITNMYKSIHCTFLYSCKCLGQKMVIFWFVSQSRFYLFPIGSAVAGAYCTILPEKNPCHNAINHRFTFCGSTVSFITWTHGESW